MASLPDNRLLLRAMQPGDIVSVHALVHAEQWPHRKTDLSDMLELGHGLVAEMGGAVVGTIMWWPCGERMISLGLMIVSRTHRGGGIGRLVLDAALDRIGDRTIVLNATEKGAPLYRKLGFRGISTILQHQGTSFSAPLIPMRDGERIRPLGESDADAVCAFVEAATGLSRPATMAMLLEQGHGLVFDRNGAIAGFALFRRFGRGYVIGPVVALEAEQATALIAQWLGMRSGEFVRLDILGDCGLGEWLEDLGLVEVGNAITMVRGPVPMPTGEARSFAIASQALC